MDWNGLGQQKWTQFQLWCIHVLYSLRISIFRWKLLIFRGRRWYAIRLPWSAKCASAVQNVTSPCHDSDELDILPFGLAFLERVRTGLLPKTPQPYVGKYSLLANAIRFPGASNCRGLGKQAPSYVFRIRGLVLIWGRGLLYSQSVHCLAEL